MTLSGKIAQIIMAEDPKDRLIKKDNKSENATQWQKIKNGIKKSVTFVTDVLLIIPRAAFHGLCNEITYIICKYVINEDRYDDDDLEEI